LFSCSARASKNHGRRVRFRKTTTGACDSEKPRQAGRKNTAWGPLETDVTHFLSYVNFPSGHGRKNTACRPLETDVTHFLSYVKLPLAMGEKTQLGGPLETDVTAIRSDVKNLGSSMGNKPFPDMTAIRSDVKNLGSSVGNEAFPDVTAIRSDVKNLGSSEFPLLHKINDNSGLLTGTWNRRWNKLFPLEIIRPAKRKQACAHRQSLPIAVTSNFLFLNGPGCRLNLT
jgi:hypothetical protein